MSLHRETPYAIESIIRDLYGTLSEEMRFEQPLRRLAAVFRSEVSGLHTEDFGAHQSQLTIIGSVDTEEFNEVCNDYSKRWSGRNLWMERSLDGFLQQGYQRGAAVVSEKELSGSSYYRHFLKPLEIHHGLGICIWQDNHLNMAVASFHRGPHSPDFDEQDIARIAQLRPHLINAYTIYRRFALLECTAMSLRSCFERAPLGMLLLDKEGRLLESNTVGDDLLATAAVRRGRDGRLLFANHSVRQGFNEAICALVNAVAPPRSLVIPSAESHTSQQLVMHLCAASHRSWGGLPPDTHILAFIASLQPGQTSALAVNILRHVLGLTPTEARVALLLREHGDAGPVAQELGLTIGTVRSHLKSTHEKLGIRRNTELLIRVERLLGSTPIPA